MNLKIVRKYKKPNYTIGKFYINDEYFCDTIEDADRGLYQEMSLQEITNLKKKNITAIPIGTYEVTLNVASPRFSSNAFYKTYANNGKLPRLLKVKGFDGVLIHCGNTSEDSAGCIIIGQNKAVGKVLNSKETFKKLYPILQTAANKKERIILNIE